MRYKGTMVFTKSPQQASCSHPGHFMNHTSSWRIHQRLSSPMCTTPLFMDQSITKHRDCCSENLLHHKSTDYHPQSNKSGKVRSNMVDSTVLTLIWKCSFLLTCKAAAAVLISFFCQFSFSSMFSFKVLKCNGSPPLYDDSFTMFLFSCLLRHPAFQPNNTRRSNNFPHSSLKAIISKSGGM